MSDPNTEIVVKKAPVDPRFPGYFYSLKGKRRIESVDELTEMLQADGPGVWFDSPEKLPKPVEKVVDDWKAKHDALAVENAELRKVNGDLVAKLMSKPELVQVQVAPKPEPKPEKPKDEPKAAK